MAVGEFALHQAVIRCAQALEQVRVICDRTYEENILALREAAPRELACHYAFALGTVMQLALHELDQLQRIGIRRAEGHEEANALALASLEAFKRQVRALDHPS